MGQARHGGKSILIVEDEGDIAQLLRYNLEREGYRCRVACDGKLALDEVRRERPDLVLLDRMLPVLAGDQVIGELKREPATARIPVLMLTAKVEESDQLVGFALGADDYIAKPFSIKLVLARVAAALRRLDTPDEATEVLTAGPLRLDAGRHEASVDGQPVSLTATEFRLLRALVAAGGRVLTRNRLIDLALGSDAAVTDRTIDVHITSIRRKLAPAAPWVQTIRGVGYTFRDPS